MYILLQPKTNEHLVWSILLRGSYLGQKRQEQPKKDLHRILLPTRRRLSRRLQARDHQPQNRRRNTCTFALLRGTVFRGGPHYKRSTTKVACSSCRDRRLLIMLGKEGYHYPTTILEVQITPPHIVHTYCRVDIITRNTNA